MVWRHRMFTPWQLHPLSTTIAPQMNSQTSYGIRPPHSSDVLQTQFRFADRWLIFPNPFHYVMAIRKMLQKKCFMPWWRSTVSPSEFQLLIPNKAGYLRSSLVQGEEPDALLMTTVPNLGYLFANRSRQNIFGVGVQMQEGLIYVFTLGMRFRDKRLAWVQSPDFSEMQSLHWVSFIKHQSQHVNFRHELLLTEGPDNLVDFFMVSTSFVRSPTFTDRQHMLRGILPEWQRIGV